MPHGRLSFVMNAPCDAVFDAFHHHDLRQRWDSLVRHPVLENGASWPSVGAVTFNPGSGWARGLSMRTKFLSFERPRLAAACMVGKSFPFSMWAASLRHEPLGGQRSLLVYTYNIKSSASLRGWAEWVVHGLFHLESRRRFRRMQRYLDEHLAQVIDWQERQRAAAALSL